MLNTLRELQRRGHAVTLLCRPGTELAQRAAAERLPQFTRPIRGDFDPVTIYQIANWLRQHPTDVILTNMDKELRLCGLAAKLVRPRPVVIARRGIDYPLKNKLHYRFAYNALADFVVANSASTKRALLQNAPWLDASRVQVIYNGIQPERYHPTQTRDLRPEFNLSPQAPVLGFVGQLDERKGIQTLLQAFDILHQQFSGAQLLMVGTGPLESQIQDFARTHGFGSHLHLVGFRNDIPNIMRTIDFLVLPSWWEGFGIVLIEAMAAGKPVITTDVSSMPEIVTHAQTGLIVPVKAVAPLAQAMQSLIQTPALAREMGARGEAVVQAKFTLTGMVDQYLALFYRLRLRG